MSTSLWWPRAFVVLLTLCVVCAAQETHGFQGHVVDASGSAVAGAAIAMGGIVVSHADVDGNFSIANAAPGVSVTCTFRGLQATVQVGTGADIEIVLRVVSIEQNAVVTTTRSSIDVGGSVNTVSTIDHAALTQYPALTLDERLRQQVGFELFRRSSSWVANPTSEGISLRGLGSTAASRTLVLSDLVPLNDGFGGWIHWNEMPPETIETVTLASGGGSDLYGSSALGGVIDIVPLRPGPVLGEADLAGASENTTNYSARLDAKQHRWSELAAGQSFRTAGYTVIAPAVRGPVDVPSNVHYQTGRIELDRAFRNDDRAWLTGNLLNEDHGNGTPLQTNGTRLWRYIASDDWTANSRISGRVRGFGSDEAYRQSFSSILSSATVVRSSEKLTRLQRVETQEFGGSTDASFHFEHLALVAGGDLRDLRATDFETPISAGAPSGFQDTSARQRFFGGFGEVLGERGGWSGAASLRLDEAQNISTDTINRVGTTAATSTRLPDRHELVVSPRLGLSKRLPENFGLHASAFRAFRTPTMNELYRTGQVGSQITLPNSTLLSERATGVEGGASWTSPRGFAATQATYFWTEINRPVSAVLLSGTKYMRENSGQIQSQGIQVGAQLHPLPDLSLDIGYQYAHAVVTAFSAQQLWIPQVPRHAVTAQLRYQHRAESFTLAARESGRAFDDSLNTYELHSFFVLDAYADYRVHSHLSLYLSFQNLLNRSIETARTPTLTLGTPFIAQGGVRLSWRRD